LHADGTYPTEAAWWQDWAVRKAREEAGLNSISSLADIFAKSKGVGSFLELLFANLWTLFVWGI